MRQAVEPQLAHLPWRPLRRDTVAQLAEALDDDQLRWWASPDIMWDRVVSIEPAGETRVIDFTVPEVHNFVAADMYLHNTALGLGMATHVAKHSGRPVLVFSLEMGHVELTQRILSSEAEVDSQKIRNGRLSEADWAKIGRAIGRLEVPLFLDDNPRVTVMEIRAKARRLKMQHGDLGMIMVDYLQLMSGGGNAENRQLEVSEISRNLKILARELEVPIVALSQLSRNLESRSDKHPMLSDLRESGCLTADTRPAPCRQQRRDHNRASSSSRGVKNVPVWSLDERYRLVPATLTHAFPSGVKPVLRMRLASGRTVEGDVRTTAFRTLDGWVPLAELDVGSRVAVPRRLDQLDFVTPMDTDESRPARSSPRRWLRRCRASRSTTRAPTRRTSERSRRLLDVGLESRPGGSAQNRWWHTYLAVAAPPHPRSSQSDLALVGRTRSPRLPQLDEVRARDCASRLPVEQIALFLRHLWATDGSLSTLRSHCEPPVCSHRFGCTTRRPAGASSMASSSYSFVSEFRVGSRQFAKVTID